jgi:hypothetical protein
VESAVNEIVSRRMIKKQQMRWNRWTVQPFLDVRAAVLNGTLEGSFRRQYPDFRPTKRDIEITAAACVPTTLHALKFGRHFAAYKVPRIHGFVAELGAALQIRCTAKALIIRTPTLQI